VGLNRHFGRVIALDETGGSDRSDRKYRTEGWDWIIAGGGVYDHLDFSFTTTRPDGSAVPLPPGTPGGGGPELRRQLRILKEFIERFDFVRMAPDAATIKSASIANPSPGNPRAPRPAVRALSQAGQAYAIYVNGGTRAELVLELPPGGYSAEWIDTKSGAIARTATFDHRGGTRPLVSPPYDDDIALRVLRALRD
jgi:hypothetical protein